jgi:hypothetical protein
VNQESIRETSIGRNHVSRSPLVELSQETRRKISRKRNKEIKRISGKLEDQRMRKLTFTTANKKFNISQERI